MPGKTPVLPKEQRQAGRWFDPSVWRADQGVKYNDEVFGRRADQLDNDMMNNVPGNFMTGPGFYSVDFSLIKYTRLTEMVNLRPDAQFFNLLNHKKMELPNNSGVINAGVGGARLVQFQAKIEF